MSARGALSSTYVYVNTTIVTKAKVTMTLFTGIALQKCMVSQQLLYQLKLVSLC